MREIIWKYFHVDGKYQLPMSDLDTKLIIVHKNFPPQKDDQTGKKKPLRERFSIFYFKSWF